MDGWTKKEIPIRDCYYLCQNASDAFWTTCVFVIQATITKYKNGQEKEKLLDMVNISVKMLPKRFKHPFCGWYSGQDNQRQKLTKKEKTIRNG